MIGPFRDNEPNPLDKPIAAVLDEMDIYGPDSEKFPAQLSYLERLTALKTVNRRQRVSADTLVTVAGSLLGILIIVAYEQKNVMTSKAFGFGIKKNS